eukprot:15088660-Alexandrium_andersonii.AAC.1
MRDSGMWLTPEQARGLKKNNSLALLSWELLSREAQEAGSARWQLKPKHHACDEIMRLAARTRRNPRSTWAMKHEGFMGDISKIANKCHPATCGRRAGVTPLPVRTRSMHWQVCDADAFCLGTREALTTQNSGTPLQSLPQAWSTAEKHAQGSVIAWGAKLWAE